MALRWLLAAVHLLALGIGLGAVLARARALRDPLDASGLRRVFAADTWWAVAAALWISSGLWRWLAGVEKPTSYYTDNHVFWLKLALLVLILALEILPIVTLTRWRRQAGSAGSIYTGAAPRLARISSVQAAIVVLMVLAATAMARGYGA